MIKYKWIPLIIILFCASCASVVTTIENPQGEVFTITSKRDALVVLKQKDGIEITLDNRGKISWIEGLLQYALAKPDVQIKNKDGD